MTLHRYWFEFDLAVGQPSPMGVRTGCGVTAFSHEDALALLRERVFNTVSLPRVRKTIEDVDVSTLDADHVLPNMGTVTTRGVWFPRGYE